MLEKTKSILDELKEIILVKLEETNALLRLIREIEMELHCVDENSECSKEYLEEVVRVNVYFYQDLMRDGRYYKLDQEEADALRRLKISLQD